MALRQEVLVGKKREETICYYYTVHLQVFLEIWVATF